VRIGGRQSAQVTDALVREEKGWYAVHTRYRQEAGVQTQLERSGLHTFLPTMTEVHQWSDRKKRVQVPLFSCYVFVRGVYSAELHQSIARMTGVVGLLTAGGKGLVVPDLEIESIQRLLACNLPLSSYPFINVGHRVRIRGGALHDIEGIVVSNTGRKLIVSVETIQRSVAVHLEDASYGIELIPARRRRPDSFVPAAARLMRAAGSVQAGSLQ